MTNTTEEVIQTLRKNRAALQNYGIRRLGLFGSAVRGTLNEKSDLDFVVELNLKSFDIYVELKEFLENLFGRKIDLVLADSIKPRLRKAILSEVVYATGL